MSINNGPMFREISKNVTTLFEAVNETKSQNVPNAKVLSVSLEKLKKHLNNQERSPSMGDIHAEIVTINSLVNQLPTSDKIRGIADQLLQSTAREALNIFIQNPTTLSSKENKGLFKWAISQMDKGNLNNLLSFILNSNGSETILQLLVAHGCRPNEECQKVFQKQILDFFQNPLTSSKL